MSEQHRFNEHQQQDQHREYDGSDKVRAVSTKGIYADRSEHDLEIQRDIEKKEAVERNKPHNLHAEKQIAGGVTELEKVRELGNPFIKEEFKDHPRI